MDAAVTIRPLAARDSFDALTALLHRAYAPLAAQGLNFNAATQNAETTRRRAAEGQCFVAELAGAVVGTVTVCGPYDIDSAPWTADVPWFRDPDTAHFHQFGVDPAVQGRGVGRQLILACEAWARQNGYRRMALDTALPADGLRALYRRMGHADVGQVQWPGRAYRSVIMQKNLDRSPLREHLQTLARYNRWATQRLFAHVDALPEADYRRDTGLFFKSIHGTLNHLLVGDRIWMTRFEGEVHVSTGLDAILFEKFEALRLEREAMDSRIEAFFGDLPAGFATRSVRYLNNAGVDSEDPLEVILPHFFNHQTHHRAQVHTLLSQLGRKPPVLDLHRVLRPNP